MNSILPMMGAIKQLRSHSSVSLPTAMKPASSGPSMFSSGTSQLSNDSSAVTEVRLPIFTRSLPTVKPGESRSTMNAEMPRLPACLLVEVKMINTLAIGALVMNIFEPLSIHRSPRCSAVVFMAAASEPEPGSVNPNAPIHSPEQSFGRYFSFCSSVPSSQIGTPQRIVCAPQASGVPASTPAAPIASIAMQVASGLASLPPYFSGKGSPSNPIPAISRQLSQLNSARASSSTARGAGGMGGGTREKLLFFFKKARYFGETEKSITQQPAAIFIDAQEYHKEI